MRWSYSSSITWAWLKRWTNWTDSGQFETAQGFVLHAEIMSGVYHS